MTKEKDLCYNIKSASRFMGLKNLRYARKYLGKPDLIEKGKTCERYLYFPETVQKAKKALEEKRAKAKAEKGKRSCYMCRRKYPQKELKCGLCLVCKVKNFLANFTCCEKCLFHKPEKERFCIIQQAFEEYKKELTAKATAKKR